MVPPVARLFATANCRLDIRSPAGFVVFFVFVFYEVREILFGSFQLNINTPNYTHGFGLTGPSCSQGVGESTQTAPPLVLSVFVVLMPAHAAEAEC